VRHWPEETRAWGMALAAEIDETTDTLETLRWSWGGIMLFARSVIASAWTWLKLPAGASLPGKTTDSPLLPRRSRLFTAAALIAAAVVLSLPLGRQAMTTVRDSWGWFWNEDRLSASTQRALNKLAARAEKENDAATLAFVALRTDDPARYAALADRAIALNPDFVWIYGATHVGLWPLGLPPQRQRLERLHASDPDNAAPVLLAADAVAQRAKDQKKPSTSKDEEALLASDPNWMALMEQALTAPRYDSYLERHYQLAGSVWKRERYLPPSVVIGGLWNEAIPNLLNLRTFSNIQAREAEKAAAAGDWNKAERLLGELDSLSERIVAANSTIIEKLVASAIGRIANQERVKLYTSAGRTADAQKAGLRLQQIDATVATLRPHDGNYGRERSYRRWGILLQGSAGLALISAFAGLAAILFLELLPARFGNRKTLWRKTVCRAADYAPATFLVASATFLLSFLPYAHAFSEFFALGNGVRNEELISDTLYGLMAVPGYVPEPRSMVIWFSGGAALVALAVFIVARRIYRSRRVQAEQT
jgi:hypothetical protein